MASIAMDIDSQLVVYDESSLDEYLRIYYQRLFPFKEMYSWLSYGNSEKDYFLRREFSFTLKGDIYTRFKSFPTLDAFSSTVKKDNPHKIDIGAVYSLPPRDKAKNESAFIAKEKELVFDIDLTDYDEIRTCCSGATICQKCWTWATISIEVMDRVLREDFGFKNLIWIYSGRRGVHCWVCDSRARILSAEARGAIADYISVITGGEGKARKVQIGAKLHPALKRAYDTILVPFFEDNILINQKLLDTEESQQKVLAAVPSETLKNAILKDWKDSDSSPLQKWEDLKKTIENSISKKEIQDINPIYDIVFTYTYPRLDVNVSIGVNHLLKSPFCVHPKTGRVCIPIDPKKCRDFNPLKAPQVQQLIAEIDDYDKKNTNGVQDCAKPMKDYKKTQLGKYIKQFKDEFLRPLQNSLRNEHRQQLQANQGEQVSIDF